VDRAVDKAYVRILMSELMMIYLPGLGDLRSPLVSMLTLRYPHDVMLC